MAEMLIPKSLGKYTPMGNCDNPVKIVVYTCVRKSTPKTTFIHLFFKEDLLWVKRFLCGNAS